MRGTATLGCRAKKQKSAYPIIWKKRDGSFSPTRHYIAQKVEVIKKKVEFINPRIDAKAMLSVTAMMATSGLANSSESNRTLPEKWQCAFSPELPCLFSPEWLAQFDG
jgi:hypothetical protein